MKEFKDNKDRKWPVIVNVGTVKRVRSLLDVDLMTVVEGDLLERLRLDPVLLVDAIYVVCQPECEKRNVSDEEFGAALTGEAIDGALTAFLEELVNFFPRPARTLLQKALAGMAQTDELAEKVLTRKIESLDETELERLISGAQSTTGRAKSASTRTRSRGGKSRK